MVKRKGKLLVIAGVLTIIGLLLASCGPAAEQPAAEQPTTGQPTTEQPTTGQPTTGQPTTGGPKGEFTVALTDMQFRNALDPLTILNASGCPIKMLLFDSLVCIDSNAKLLPALAESWKIADDWSKIDFTLRQGVKWSNGDPFTAKDVKFTIDKFTAKDSMYHYSGDFKKSIKEVVVVDDYHVTFFLSAPFPVIFDRLNDTGGMVPKDYYEKMGQQGFAAKPVGAGPFKIIDFKDGQFINVEAVVNHYRKTPYVEKVHLVFVTEAMTQLAMLKTGEVDMINANVEQIPDVQKDSRLKIYPVNYSSQQAICFHDLRYPETTQWTDLRVRQAASVAIDRVTICKKVFYDVYLPSSQFLAPFNLGYDPTLPVLPYDPVKAKQLLADAGYPNGFETTLTFSGSTTQPQIVSAYLGDVGIRVKLKAVESATLSTLRSTSYSNPTSPNVLRGLTLYSVPVYNGIIHSGGACESQMGGGSLNSAGLTNPGVKALIEESMKYQQDDPRLAEVAKKFNELELKDLWHCPLWVNNTQWAADNTKVAEVLWKPGRTGAILFELVKLK
ncbi:MAG: ABC transporter substrate-binding protein [Chloroflexota bacterium]